MNWEKNRWLYWVFVAGLIAFWFLIRASYVQFILHYVMRPLNFYDWPKILALLVFIPLSIMPFFLISFFILFFFFKVYDQKNGSNKSFIQLNNLNKARKTLASSLKYLEKLHGSIQDSQKQQKELRLLVESLKKASRESASDLKKKLEAIGYVNRKKEYLRFALGFALGVISSLMATAVWSLLITK